MRYQHVLTVVKPDGGEDEHTSLILDKPWSAPHYFTFSPTGNLTIWASARTPDGELETAAADRIIKVYVKGAYLSVSSEWNDLDTAVDIVTTAYELRSKANRA